MAWLNRKAAELLAAYRAQAQPASRTPGNPLGALTFAETERLWREEVAPLLPEFTSMNRRPGQERVGPASPWAPNEVSDAYLMHDRLVAVRGEHVEEVWPVAARGHVQ